MIVDAVFQSSLPRGERPTAAISVSVRINFNPRSHEGSDKSPMFASAWTCDFNPRSHEGSDVRESKIKAYIQEISILAPTRGATFPYEFIILSYGNFNPRSHEGSDSNFRQKVLFSLSKNCLKYLILTTNYFN